MTGRLGAGGILVCLVCLCGAGCVEDGARSGGIGYLPSALVQPDEYVRVTLASGATSSDWSVAQAPAGAEYVLSPEGSGAVFRARTPGEYLLRAVPAPGTNAEEETVPLRVAEPACSALQGTIVGITGGSPNRFVHVDPCTGALTELAVVGGAAGAPLVGFPQGIYAVDPVRRRLYVERRPMDGEPRLIGIDVDTGAEEVDMAIASPGLSVIEVDRGEGDVLVVTDGAAPRLQRIDPDAGTLTDVGPLGSGTVGLQGIYALDAGRHRLYFVFDDGGGNDHLVAVDTRTAARVVDVLLPVRELRTIRFDAAAGVLYGLTSCCPSEFVTIDPESGALTPLALLGDSTVLFPQGIDGFAPEENRYVYVPDEGGTRLLRTVDTRSGSLTSSVVLPVRELFVVEYVPAR